VPWDPKARRRHRGSGRMWEQRSEDRWALLGSRPAAGASRSEQARERSVQFESESPQRGTTRSTAPPGATLSIRFGAPIEP